MRLNFTRHELDLVLTQILKHTDFATVPSLIETDAFITPKDISFKTKVFGVAVGVNASVWAVEGAIEVNITQALGAAKGIVRPFIEKQIQNRLSPYSDYVKVIRPSDGNIILAPGTKFGILGVSSIQLGDDSVSLELTLGESE